MCQIEKYLPKAYNDVRISNCWSGPLAQLAEQGTLNAKVRGSSPWRVICDSGTVWCRRRAAAIKPFFCIIVEALLANNVSMMVARAAGQAEPFDAESSSEPGALSKSSIFSSTNVGDSPDVASFSRVASPVSIKHVAMPAASPILMSVSSRSPTIIQRSAGRLTNLITVESMMGEGLPTIGSQRASVQASMAAITAAASGWPPPGTGQYRSPFVATKRAPARIASNAT
jgi:hypothetical protein